MKMKACELRFNLGFPYCPSVCVCVCVCVDFRTPGAQLLTDMGKNISSILTLSITGSNPIHDVCCSCVFITASHWYRFCVMLLMLLAWSPLR